VSGIHDALRHILRGDEQVALLHRQFVAFQENYPRPLTT
jgi:hypothetical protein